MCPPTSNEVKGHIREAAREFWEFAEPKLPSNWKEVGSYYEYAIDNWPPISKEGKFMSTHLKCRCCLLGLFV